MASYDRTKKTHESPDGKYSFSAKMAAIVHGVSLNARNCVNK